METVIVIIVTITFQSIIFKQVSPEMVPSLLESF